MHVSIFPACTYVLYVSGIHGVWRCQVVVSHHVNRNPLLQKRQVFSQLSHLSNQIDSFKSVSQTILGRKNYGWLFLPWGIVLIRNLLFASYTDCCWLVDNLLKVCQLSAFCYLFFCWFCCFLFFQSWKDNQNQDPQIMSVIPELRRLKQEARLSSTASFRPVLVIQ